MNEDKYKIGDFVELKSGGEMLIESTKIVTVYMDAERFEIQESDVEKLIF